MKAVRYGHPVKRESETQREKYRLKKASHFFGSINFLHSHTLKTDA